MRGTSIQHQTYKRKKTFDEKHLTAARKQAQGGHRQNLFEQKAVASFWETDEAGQQTNSPSKQTIMKGTGRSGTGRVGHEFSF